MALWRGVLLVTALLCGASVAGALPSVFPEVQGRMARHLLMEEDHLNNTNTTDKAVVPEKSQRAVDFTYLTVGLGVVLAVSLLIVAAVKFRFFHRFLASYRHSLLRESDGVSQFSPEDPPFPSSITGRIGGRRAEVDDDDDGFIEDNYIQAGEKSRSERVIATDEHDLDDSDDDLQFTIG